MASCKDQPHPQNEAHWLKSTGLVNPFRVKLPIYDELGMQSAEALCHVAVPADGSVC
jgi:hypothetical protein